MTVRITDGAVFLEGDCAVEDGATLAQLLAVHPQAIVDWSACDSVHTAVFQVLFAVRPPLRGAPRGDFLLTHLAPLLAHPLPSGTAGSRKR
jgi:hypothetical protein